MTLRPDELFFHHYQPSQFDVNFDFCGRAQGLNATSNGLMIKSNYVLHYVTAGHGFFEIHGNTVSLGPGDCFILPKNTRTRYWPDPDLPWGYIWLGLSGSQVGRYLRRSALMQNDWLHAGIDSALATQIWHLSALTQAPLTAQTDLQVTAAIYQLLYILSSDFPKPASTVPSLQAQYLLKATNYIQNNYDKPLTVSDLAKLVNLNRSYLYKLFKQHLDTSPQQYLKRVRLTKSVDLLMATDYSVKQIASAVGYPDAFGFSKLFHAYYHCSPSEYRKHPSQTITPH